MENNNNSWSIFWAIIVAGLIIAGSIVLVFYLKRTLPANTGSPINQEEGQFAIKSISEKDHILGNPNASIYIIEYSDLQCEHCKSIHPTLSRIIDEIGPEGEVAWVYRHFPIDNHPEARYAAEVSECISQHLGQEAFWNFIKTTFDNQASLTKDKIDSMAKEIGASDDQLNSCRDSEEIKSAVESDYQDGLIIYKTDKSFGTPYLIFYKNGVVETRLAGALTYSSIKNILEALLAI